MCTSLRATGRSRNIMYKQIQRLPPRAGEGWDGGQRWRDARPDPHLLLQALPNPLLCFKCSLVPRKRRARKGTPLIVTVQSLAIAFFIALPCALTPAAEPKWPARPIRMIHGFIAGGNVDITARLLAAQMSETYGLQVIVDGRPGAGGTNGAAIVAKAEPDGHTIFLMASGHATSPALYRKLPYDPVNDFVMISMVASNPMVVLSSPSFAAKSIQDVVQLAKNDPQKINYGTGGVGSGMHLAAVLFQARAGVKMNVSDLLTASFP